MSPLPALLFSHLFTVAQHYLESTYTARRYVHIQLCVNFVRRVSSPGLSIQSLFTYICVLSLYLLIFPNKSMFKPTRILYYSMPQVSTGLDGYIDAGSTLMAIARY